MHNMLVHYSPAKSEVLILHIANHICIYKDTYVPVLTIYLHRSSDSLWIKAYIDIFCIMINCADLSNN